MSRRPLPRSWWAVALAGVVAVAVGAVLLGTARRLPPTFAAATPAAAESEGRAAATSAAPLTAPSDPTATAAAPAVVAPVPFRPVTVGLDAFGVQASVVPVFTAAGVLDPPDDPSTLGWWGAGQLAGATTGATVVVGHVDGPAGPGALYRLVHAVAGDRIVVAGSNGQRVTYAVTSLSYHVKGSDLPAALFAPDGPPRLVVVSCGGSFDRSDDQYADNVVVQAAPV